MQFSKLEHNSLYSLNVDEFPNHNHAFLTPVVVQWPVDYAQFLRSSQNLSIYGFPKVGRAGMYRESLASPVTLTLLTENIKHETTVDRRGKEGKSTQSLSRLSWMF